jgi:DNA-binding FadR family transcriptional regulator
MTKDNNSLLSELAAYLYSCSDDKSGRMPSERELAEHFSVSRGQLREALAILEAMQIVERRAKSGIYLTTTKASVEAMALFAKAGVPLDPVQIYETVELRKIHEIKAAELASSRATEENFKRLREILDASEKKLAAGEGLAVEDRESSTAYAASTTSWANRGCRSISRIPIGPGVRMPNISRSTKHCFAAMAILPRL